MIHCRPEFPLATGARIILSVTFVTLTGMFQNDGLEIRDMQQTTRTRCSRSVLGHGVALGRSESKRRAHVNLVADGSKPC